MSAIIQAILHVEKPYMITQKGGADEHSLPSRTLMPYLLLGYISLLANVLYLSLVGNGASQVYMLFTLIGALLMFLVCVAPCAVALKNSGVKFFAYQKLNVGLLALCFASLALVSIYSESGIREALRDSEDASVVLAGVK
jgi:hypothetical protein